MEGSERLVIFFGSFTLQGLNQPFACEGGVITCKPCSITHVHSMDATCSCVVSVLSTV